LTPSEQRLLRNLPYAHRGYVFNDAKLNEYFSQFFWYMPDSTWKASSEDFTENEVKMVEWAKKALIKL
ncbi:MAG: YARHG domain-containing protein, partial [Bacteroidaceae bacterium]|nr:YARHG domain-containing protein [Bacteroidaceae bacterium]